MNKTEIKKRAQYFAQRYFFSWYKAVRTAINEHRLNAALETQDFVYFQFKKKEGDLRTVLATKMQHLIPNEILPNGRGSGYSELQVRFVDTNLGEWRSCIIDRLVRIYW